MGDLQVWPLQPNGVLSEENPQPGTIGEDKWVRAEKRTCEIICKIQPTIVSEQRRNAVVDYVQRLIRSSLGCEVFAFGSVPLKTYLPDGDIDLTTLSPFPNIEDALANDVRSVLEGEEQNKAAEFEVKDVQYIHAEVKLLKCLVQNIVVDISFNQLGGLCTLCFLERVDRLIGEDHLFKRSIILIKAWCYYESRILGAHHGLISTYALETLVLYIFHLFHSSLHGPLEVLYRFLDYYSKFDWDNYCVSLNGPVCVSSLTEIAAETTENDGDDLLLGKGFLRSCVDMYSVLPKGPESNLRSFPMKHLNIVDPLKENNNLGRSVSKGNFYRIRSAFTYGARKLGRILLLSEENITKELNKFFTNTLDRHGSGQRPDVQDPLPISLTATVGLNGSGLVSSKSDPKKPTEDKTPPESPSIDYNSKLCEEINNFKVSEPEGKDDNKIKSKGQFLQPSASEVQMFTKIVPSSTILESNGLADGNAVSGSRVAGDATDLASSRISCPRITNSELSPLNCIQGNLSSGRAYYAPHLYYSENGNMDQPSPKNSNIHESKMVSHSQSSVEIAGLVLKSDSTGRGFLSDDPFRSNNSHESPSTLSSNNGFLVSNFGRYPSEDLFPSNQSFVNNDSCESSSRANVGFREMELASNSGTDEAFNSLSELSGDYESHQRSLRYGQWCHELILYGPVLPYPQSSSYLYNKHPWEVLRGPPQLKRNVFPHMGANGVVPARPFSPASGYYPLNPPPIVSGAFSVEEQPKPRGTGTYFPNPSHRSYKERHSPGRGRNTSMLPHGQLQRPRNNGRAVMAPESFLEKAGHEQSQPQFPVFNGNGRGKPGSMEFVPSFHPVISTTPNSNGLSSESLKFGSLESVPLVALLPEQAQRPDSSALHNQTSASMLPMPTTPRPGLGLNQERVAQSYHLKDEDFPPLSENSRRAGLYTS